MAKTSLLRKVLEAVVRQDGRDGIVRIADHFDAPHRKSNAETITEICRALRYDLSRLISAKGPWKRDVWNDLLEAEFGIERRKSYDDIVFELEWLEKQEGGRNDKVGEPRHHEPAPSTGAPASSASQGDDWKGQLVGGRWRILERLGKGGFGEVFRVNDEKEGLGKCILKRALDVDKEARLRDEIARAMGLGHANICAYRDINDDPTFGRYLVLQDGGRSLEELIDGGHEFEVEDALDIAEQVGAALDHAHRERVLHLDVKPGNVLVRGDRATRRVLLSDFGISQLGRLTQRADGRHTLAASRISYLSLNYSAPEQLVGDATSASDRYCLALVFCSMLEGEVFSHVYRPRPFGRLSDAQNRALATALHPSPEQRFPSCAAFIRAMGK